MCCVYTYHTTDTASCIHLVPLASRLLPGPIIFPHPTHPLLSLASTHALSWIVLGTPPPPPRLLRYQRIGSAFYFRTVPAVLPQYGQWEKALDTLSKLVSEKPPKHSLMWGYNAAISALGKAKQMEGVKDLLATMRASGVYMCMCVCDFQRQRVLDVFSLSGHHMNCRDSELFSGLSLCQPT